MTRALVPLLVLACLAAGSCSDAPAPTRPQRLPDAASYIPAAPAPQPTPTPAPGTEPADEPLPATPGQGADSPSSECGDPVPPPLSRLNVKVHATQGDRVVLDSTPLVGPDAGYCRLIGYPDGRSFCPVRPEGHPERPACEAARVGRASDTGRVGPTWSANGNGCGGRDGEAWCLNHASNQFLVYAAGAGTFRACSASGVCGALTLP